MGETTKIQWCDATVNAWWGCTKISPACASCYAATFAARFGQAWGKGTSRTLKPGFAKVAMKLDRRARKEYRRLRVFSASMSDWLDEEVPVAWLVDLLNVVRQTPHLDWLMLSKRVAAWPLRMGYALSDARERFGWPGVAEWIARWLDGDAPKNVWIGATAEDQQRATERVPALLAIPASVHFLSAEPLLERVDLFAAGAFPQCLEGGDESRVDWIIGGGESGARARESDLDWFRFLRDQARTGGAAFFMKQLGGHPDKRGELEAFPEDLRMREFPVAR